MQRTSPPPNNFKSFLYTRHVSSGYSKRPLVTNLFKTVDKRDRTENVFRIKWRIGYLSGSISIQLNTIGKVWDKSPSAPENNKQLSPGT